MTEIIIELISGRKEKWMRGRKNGKQKKKKKKENKRKKERNEREKNSLVAQPTFVNID